MQDVHLVVIWEGGQYISAAFVKESDRDPSIHTVLATLSQIEPESADYQEGLHDSGIIELARKLAAELNDIADQLEETANV